MIYSFLMSCSTAEFDQQSSATIATSPASDGFDTDGEEEEEEEEELTAVPPVVISGAYISCNTSTRNADNNTLTIGCVLMKDDKIIDYPIEASDVLIKDATGNALVHKFVEIIDGKYYFEVELEAPADSETTPDTSISISYSVPYQVDEGQEEAGEENGEQEENKERIFHTETSITAAEIKETPEATDEIDAKDPAATEANLNKSTDTETDPNDPTGTETDPKDPAATETDPNEPADIKTNPDEPAGSETDPKDPEDTETDPNDPEGTETDPKDPEGTETDPNEPAGSESDPEGTGETPELDPVDNGETPDLQAVPYRVLLSVGESMPHGTDLCSPNGIYCLKLQRDRNVIIQEHPEQAVISASNTNLSFLQDYKLKMEWEGKLCVHPKYGTEHGFCFVNLTVGGGNPRLILNDEGVLGLKSDTEFVLSDFGILNQGRTN